ncbi:HAD-IA family hydrolase [Cohnella sp. CFH 77786]|uniref:HAD family hydrolase n=1 Tax=Cohnella sp. CFH 77786 TaxID=2662265 RepID=UPI001C60C270|nr:HAD family hydrolase [Cohnella sp. CFH 77786]MBW5446219.1 HAD-IA family hydrolase [Cohnella sp. CFH 77786]
MNWTRAVLFDLDNTILDRTLTFRRFAESFVDSYLGDADTKQDIVERIIVLDRDGYKDKEELFTELLEELPWKVKPSVAELMEYYGREYVNNAVLMDQAREVLQDLKARFKIGLITNGKTRIQYGKIDRLGIRELFDVILVSEEAGVKKPDSRIFEMALERLSLHAEACLYIGDHPANDIEGACKAGMQTIWMQVNQPWRDGLKAKPIHTIRNLAELLPLVP